VKLGGQYLDHEHGEHFVKDNDAIQMLVGLLWQIADGQPAHPVIGRWLLPTRQHARAMFARPIGPTSAMRPACGMQGHGGKTSCAPKDLERLKAEITGIGQILIS
jgi:hypothetical protein